MLRTHTCQTPLNKIYLCIPVLEPEEEGDTIRRNVWRYSITSQKILIFFSCALRISNPAAHWRHVAILNMFRFHTMAVCWLVKKFPSPLPLPLQKKLAHLHSKVHYVGPELRYIFWPPKEARKFSAAQGPDSEVVPRAF